jgi:hypothetical protein
MKQALATRPRVPMARNRNYPVSSQAWQLSYEGGRPVLHLGTRKYQDVIKRQHYDVFRFKGGTIMPVNKDLNFFQVKIGNKRQVANDPTIEYVTTRVDTSLASNFVVDKDHQFICTSLQFHISSLGNLPLATGTDEFVQLPVEIGGTTGNNNWGNAQSQAALVEVCQNFFYVKTKFGNSGRDHEEGLMIFFPTQYGKSGSGGLSSVIGSGGTAAPLVINESSFSNGYGYANQLLNPRVLDSLDGVKIAIEALVPFKISGPFQVKCIMDGFEARPV